MIQYRHNKERNVLNMNELNELEKWLTTVIKHNDELYEYASNANDNKTASGCVCRGLAYERVLHKIRAIQRAQKG